MITAGQPLAARARDTLRRLVIGLGLIAGTAAIAAPVIDAGGLKLARAEVASAMQTLPRSGALAPAQVQRLVWSGADLDGDGQADFANPTGQGERVEDAYGEGRFGASRDGGSRRHEGVDFIADVGQPVNAPISGYVTKIGYAYPGDRDLKFVEITNPALHYVARVFYVDPSVVEGETVAIGRPIGRGHSLQRKYPGGMTNHVHLEIIDTRGAHIDPARVLTARWEKAPNPRG